MNFSPQALRRRHDMQRALYCEAVLAVRPVPLNAAPPSPNFRLARAFGGPGAGASR